MIEDPDPDPGPVLVTVKYVIGRAKAAEFLHQVHNYELSVVTMARKAWESSSTQKHRTPAWRTSKSILGRNTSGNITASPRTESKPAGDKPTSPD
jgi:hypothetical protein